MSAACQLSATAIFPMSSVKAANEGNHKICPIYTIGEPKKPTNIDNKRKARKTTVKT